MYLVTAIRRIKENMEDWLVDNWRNSNDEVVKTTRESLLSKHLSEHELNQKIMLAINNILSRNEAESSSSSSSSSSSASLPSSIEDKFQALEKILKGKAVLLQEQFVMFFVYRYMDTMCDEAQKRLSSQDKREGSDKLLFSTLEEVLLRAKQQLENFRKEASHPVCDNSYFQLKVPMAVLKNEAVLEGHLEVIKAFFQFCIQVNQTTRDTSRGMIDCSFQNYTNSNLLHVAMNREAADYCFDKLSENYNDTAKISVIVNNAAFMAAQNGESQDSCEELLKISHKKEIEAKEKQGYYTIYPQRFNLYLAKEHGHIVHHMENKGFNPKEHYSCRFGV